MQFSFEQNHIYSRNYLQDFCESAGSKQQAADERGVMNDSMSTAVDMLNCAACGRGGDGLKTCTACKMVKYCNATCQKAHRPVHMKECKKRAAELRDEALFKKPRRGMPDLHATAAIK